MEVIDVVLISKNSVQSYLFFCTKSDHICLGFVCVCLGVCLAFLFRFVCLLSSPPTFAKDTRRTVGCILNVAGW